MAAAYPDGIVTEYYNGTSWVNISSYVVSDIIGNSGMASSKPDDRVAALGVLTLELNNDARLFTPYGGDAVRGIPTMTGWKKGAKVRISIVIGTITYIFWVGRIADLSSDDGTWGTRRVYVTLVDWMNVASRFPMRGSEIQLSKRVNEAAALLLERLSVQPEGTDFDMGDDILEAVFSNVKDKTKAISELNKLMMSEWGFAYVTRDGKLRIENSSARPGTRDLDTVPIHPSLRNTLDLESGEAFTLENGEFLALDEVEEPVLSLTAEKLDIELKDDVINIVNVKAYPTRTATSLEVVASLGSPIHLMAGTVYTLTLRYKDPNGSSPISATNLQTPILNTDYALNEEEDGSGADLGVALTVEATYYGDQVDYVLTTTNVGEGWLTLLQARGYGIYYDSPISLSISDEESVEEGGDVAMDIDQRYQSNLYRGEALARSIIEEYSTSKSRVRKARYLANLNHSHLMACVHLDVGGLVKIYDNRSEMYKWYYITARNFVITLGMVIHVTFSLVEAPSIQSGGLTPVPVDFGNYAWTAFDYGHAPQAWNPMKRSITAKVRLRNAVAGRMIYNITDTSGSGFSFAFGGTDQLQFYEKNSLGPGIWLTPASSIAVDTDYTLVVTRDRSVDPDADPIIYINGTVQSITESSTPNGAIISEEGLRLYIGSESLDAILEDVRMYDRIITPTEVTTITNADAYADVVTDGMVFQSQTINSDYGDAADFTDGDLPDDVNLIDNVFRLVGERVIPTFADRDWTLRTTPNDTFLGVAWSPTLELFVAVGNGSTSSIMTSSNGKAWTSRASGISLFNVAWSEEQALFVAVGNNTVRTSTDGTTWTPRTAAAANDWRGITYSPELNLWVATSIDGTVGQRVMTSPDGTTWTIRNGKGGIHVLWVAEWGLFISCDYNASTTSISTSTDGITWVDRTTPSAALYGLAYSPELNRAVATGDSVVLYSGDGINWTSTSAIQLENWRKVEWSPELGIFMTVGDTGGGLHSQYSDDGITWTGLSAAANYGWYGIAYSPKLVRFVAVQYNTSNTTRVMTF